MIVLFNTTIQVVMTQPMLILKILNCLIKTLCVSLVTSYILIEELCFLDKADDDVSIGSSDNPVRWSLLDDRSGAIRER